MLCSLVYWNLLSLATKRILKFHQSNNRNSAKKWKVVVWGTHTLLFVSCFFKSYFKAKFQFCWVLLVCKSWLKMASTSSSRYWHQLQMLLFWYSRISSSKILSLPLCARSLGLYSNYYTSPKWSSINYGTSLWVWRNTMYLWFIDPSKILLTQNNLVNHLRLNSLDHLDQYLKVCFSKCYGSPNLMQGWRSGNQFCAKRVYCCCNCEQWLWRSIFGAS